MVIPREHEDAILTAAEEIDRKEGEIRKLVLDGLHLDEARIRLAYHKLQSKPKRWRL